MTDHDTAAVIRTVNALSPGDGQVALCWLGQSGFLMRGAGVTCIIDPFLSPGHDRVVPPAFDPVHGHGIDVIACTHQHIDHFDPPTVKALAEASPGARVIVPQPIVSMATELGIAAERVIGAQPDRSIEVGGLTIHPVPACHGVHMSDAYSFGEQLSNGLVRFLGYVLLFPGVAVYHAGDTLLYAGQEDLLRALGVHLALLPINGRDAWRERQDLVGNMDPRDAAHLARAAGCRTLIPMHYDMFPTNLGYPDLLVQYVRDQRLALPIHVPAHGDVFIHAAV